MFNLKTMKNEENAHIKIIGSLSSSTNFEKFKKTMVALSGASDDRGLTMLVTAANLMEDGQFFHEFAEAEDGTGTMLYKEKLGWLKDLASNLNIKAPTEFKLIHSTFVSREEDLAFQKKVNKLKTAVKHIDEEIVKVKKYEDDVDEEIIKMARNMTSFRKKMADKFKKK
jgi:hypothetical protein